MIQYKNIASNRSASEIITTGLFLREREREREGERERERDNGRAWSYMYLMLRMNANKTSRKLRRLAKNFLKT